MSEFEVAEPILNSPFEEPRRCWYIREGETPRPYLRDGQTHEYVPDFLIQFKYTPGMTLILETKDTTRWRT